MLISICSWVWLIEILKLAILVRVFYDPVYKSCNIRVNSGKIFSTTANTPWNLDLFLMHTVKSSLIPKTLSLSLITYQSYKNILSVNVCRKRSSAIPLNISYKNTLSFNCFIIIWNNFKLLLSLLDMNPFHRWNTLKREKRSHY